MAKAIGPQNTVGAIGIMPSAGTGRCSHRLQPARHRCRERVGLDLADHDHRILRDHADEREHAENGDEAERPACAYRKLDPHILVMQSTQNRAGEYATHDLNRARNRDRSRSRLRSREAIVP
jgi:hypothetical protein